MRRVHVNFSFAWPFSPDDTRELLTWIFQTALLSYLGLYLIESLQPGFVTYYFNLHALLWATILAGVISSVWPMAIPEARHHPRLAWKDYLWLAVIAVAGAGVVWYKTKSIGQLNGVITILSGIIIFGLGLLVYLDNDERAGD